MGLGLGRETGEFVLAQPQTPLSTAKVLQDRSELPVRSAEVRGPRRRQGLQRRRAGSGQFGQNGLAIHHQAFPAIFGRPHAGQHHQARWARQLGTLGVQFKVAASEAGKARPTIVLAGVTDDGQPIGVGVAVLPRFGHQQHCGVEDIAATAETPELHQTALAQYGRGSFQPVAAQGIEGEFLARSGQRGTGRRHEGSPS